MLPKEMSYTDRFKTRPRSAASNPWKATTMHEPREAEEIKKAADAAGVPIHSVMNMDHWQIPLSSGDPAVVEKSLAGMRTSLRNAKLWGAEHRAAGSGGRQSADQLPRGLGPLPGSRSGS